MVRKEAEKLADGMPFCIQIADRKTHEYRPVASLLDLSPFRMTFSSFGYHAVMEIQAEQPELYNWSYLKKRFDRQTVFWPAIYCQPQENFLKNIPLLFVAAKAPETSLRFKLHDQHYSIPMEYHPSVGSSMQRIQIMATPPVFTPFDNNASDEPLDHELTMYLHIDYVPREIGLSENYRIQSRGNSYGLDFDKRAFKGVYSYTHYFLKRNDGSLLTEIICNSVICLHRFWENGAGFDFRYHPKNIPYWKEMQDNAMTLFRSFTSP